MLEFPDEADAFLENFQRRGLDASAAQIISLDPKVQIRLIHSGVRCIDTLPYFTSKSHARGLRKADQLVRWIEERIHLEDSLGVSETYDNAFSWYVRFSIYHMVRMAEILDGVLTRHPEARLHAFVQRRHGASCSWKIQDSERFLGGMTEDLCLQRDIPFSPIPMSAVMPGNRRRSLPLWTRGIAWRVASRLHQGTLRRLGRSAPLLALTHTYRMDGLVAEVQRQLPHVPWVVIGGGEGSLPWMAQVRRVFRAFTAGLGSRNGDQYQGEVWLPLLERPNREDHAFVSKLTQRLEALAVEVEGQRVLFSHRGVFFGDLVASRMRTGIMSSMHQLHRQVAAVNGMLELLRPRLIMAPFGRESNYAFGELGRHHGIPGILISHGSFTPMKSDLEQMAWTFHSHGLLHGGFSHAALQSPLAEEFTQQISSSTEFIPTGPLIWGRPVNMEKATLLRSKLLGRSSGCRVVLHASTIKLRLNTHFNIYETTDEYLQGLKDLIAAIHQIPEVHLIIKFRPIHLTVNDLEALLPHSDRVTISADEPFLDVLGLADLLVSFSSTTIEEALMNRVPVLLYGGDGRYQHVEARIVTPKDELEPSAVYAVRRPEFLADGLQRIMDIHCNNSVPGELFDPYIYREDRITRLPDLVRSLVDPKIPADEMRIVMKRGKNGKC